MDGKEELGSPELMDFSTPLFSHGPISCPKNLDLQLFFEVSIIVQFPYLFYIQGTPETTYKT